MKKYILSFITTCFILGVGYGQDNLTYQLPPKSIVDLVDAKETPDVIFNYEGSLMLILDVPGYASIEHVSQKVLGLAGIKVNPANNSTENEVAGVYSSFSMKNVKTGKTYSFSGLPAQPRLANIAWSPDGNYVAFSNNGYTGVELWLADIKNLKAKKLSNAFLNDAFGNTLQWNPDGKHILAQFTVPGRGKPPIENPVPTGPIVQENMGLITPAVTYEYLLKNPYDEKLMDYYLASQLKSVGLDGSSVKIGNPQIYKSASYSPNGKYLLVQTVEKPYSYLLPISFFPLKTTVLNAQGGLIKVLNNAPLEDKLPIGFDAVAKGPRSYKWRSDLPASVIWVEAQDQGDPNVKVDFRDMIYSLQSPFNSKPEQYFQLQLRYSGIDWINQKYAVVKEQWRKDRTFKINLIDAGSGKIVKNVLSGSSEDTYTNPGNFVYSKNSPESLLLNEKDNPATVFTIGQGASPIGDRPFLMKWDLITDQKDTLFKSDAPYYEMPVFFNDNGYVYISRESSEDAPNYYMVNLKSAITTPLTSFPDPYPGLKGTQKVLLSYPREDGLKLSAMLYLPKGYKKSDGPLPVLIWAYPREYKTRQAAGQVKGSPYRFSKLAFRSPVYWVTRGYAILDQADMPIVGEGKNEPNDTFLKQIEQNAKALIDYVVDSGIADRNRIAIGGHSYGAFMTVNLLAHTNLFAAGIARSGAYNRTLTPFGFQGERRTYWEAPEVYNTMSPFNYADKIKTPLLITHGMIDDNSGTFPIQSERLYSAIKGHGGTVRLVMLPKEFHGYRSRESVLHTFWEQDQWLERYVKNRKLPKTE
ncbi:MAG: prolyl oligopeptidase family serine peptidase [Ginsengibacter sp.]